MLVRALAWATRASVVEGVRQTHPPRPEALPRSTRHAAPRRQQPCRSQQLGEAHVADFDRDHNQAGLGAPLSVASIGPPDRGQADAIDAVRIQGATGRGLVAFFGCMYYA